MKLDLWKIDLQDATAADTAAVADATLAETAEDAEEAQAAEADGNSHLSIKLKRRSGKTLERFLVIKKYCAFFQNK